MARLGPLPTLLGSKPNQLSDSKTPTKSTTSTKSEFQATRLALRWTPPTLALEYIDPADNSKKVRLFPVDLSKNDARKIAVALQEAHPLYLHKSIVRTEQLKSLMVKLLANKGKPSKSPAPQPSSSASNSAGAPMVSRGTLADSSLSANGSVTNGSANKPKQTSINSSGIVTGPSGLRAPASKGSALAPSLHLNLKGLGLGDGFENLDLSDPPEEDGEDAAFIPQDADPDDLNHADDETLRRAKADMDKDFQKNRLKKGDKGFVYDKRFEAPSGPKQASEFDD